MCYVKAFIMGFIEGTSDFGRTYKSKLKNEVYDWGRSLRRLRRR